MSEIAVVVGLVDANIQTAVTLGNLSFSFVAVIAHSESPKLPGTGPSPGLVIWPAGAWVFADG